MTQTLYSRNGFKWNINEVLSLQREWELLSWDIPKIAEKHKRSHDAIMYKLDKEGFACYKDLLPTLDKSIPCVKNKSFEEEGDLFDDSKSDEDYVFEEDEDDDISSDEDTIPDEFDSWDKFKSSHEFQSSDRNMNYLFKRIQNLEGSILHLLTFQTPIII
jgi:hypothetical protein